VTKLVTTIVMALFVLLALPPVILLTTVCVALLRCLWFYTR